MTVRTRFLAAAVLGWCVTQTPAAPAAEPPAEPGRLGVAPAAPLPVVGRSPNQQMADTIAGQLHQSGQLRRYTVNVAFCDSTAELSGAVADQSQKEEVLRIVQGVPGVERVVDRMTLVSGPIVPVQAEVPQARPQLPPPLPNPTPAGPQTAPVEPTPIFQAGPQGGPYDLNPPKMPPYAWPTYAPYNNFSRVAYPTAYPYNAFPFIGPVYPFPKVPLGWRSVKLEWDDGHWWFSRTATKYDWWHLRHW